MVYLCLDNDEAGEDACESMMEVDVYKRQNPEIASKDYLSLFPGAFSSGPQKGDDFRVVLEETLGIGCLLYTSRCV